MRLEKLNDYRPVQVNYGTVYAYLYDVRKLLQYWFFAL